MFRCDICHKPSLSSESCNKVTIEKRNKTYSLVSLRRRRSSKKRIIENVTKDSDIVKMLIEKENWEFVRGWSTKGQEIAKEINTCNKCYTLKKGLQAAEEGHVEKVEDVDDFLEKL